MHPTSGAISSRASLMAVAVPNGPAAVWPDATLILRCRHGCGMINPRRIGLLLFQ